MAGSFIGEPWKMPYTKEQLQAAVENQIPIIGENGNWWRWNIAASAFEDTGVQAAGTGTVNSVNGITPVSGNVALAAHDIGAVSESDTAPVEASATASQAYSAGALFLYGGTLYRATAAIFAGDTIEPGVNVTATTVAGELAALEGGKLDAPENEGTAGQVPVLQADGSTLWADAGGGLLPQLIVTTEPGTSVTATLGGVTIGPVVADEDGLATLELTDYGEWAVTAARDAKSNSTTLTVDAVKMYEIEVFLIPPGYTELAYIENSGTQYLNLGLHDVENHRLVGTVYVTAFRSKIHCDLYGNSNGVNNNGVVYSRGDMIMLNSNSIAVESNNGAYSTYPISPSLWGTQLNTTYTIDIFTGSVSGAAPRAAIINGEAYALAAGGSGTGSYGDTTGLDKNLFATQINDSSVHRYIAAGLRIIGHLDIYSSDDADATPTMSLYPARRDSDDVVGMYDTVSNTFFTNQGSGSFIAGPEV